MLDICFGEFVILMFIFEKKKCFDNFLFYKGDKINSLVVVMFRI